MKLHELGVKSTKPSRRKGRGIAAGRGKTAGRGTKGQNSRTGGGVKPGFEGGQTKFSMRMPKNRGFKAKNRVEYQVVTTAQLDSLGKTAITKDDLVNAKLANTVNPIKLLFAGDVKKKYTVSLDAASKSAAKAVEKAGGSVSVYVPKPKTSKKAKEIVETKPEKLAVKK